MFNPKYPKVDRRVVRGVRAFLDSKPYRADQGGKVAAVNALAAVCAQTYRFPTPRITIEPHAAEAGTLGLLDADCNTVILPRLSLAATLYQMARLRGLNDRKAKNWAASAIHLASPKTLRNFVRSGAIRWKGTKAAVRSTQAAAV